MTLTRSLDIPIASGREKDMVARSLLTFALVAAAALPAYGQAVRTTKSSFPSPTPAPYNAQLMTDPDVGNVQGIQRYGRPMRTDPDQGEGYSYHVYPVAYPQAPRATFGAPLGVAPELEGKIKEAVAAVKAAHEAFKQAKDLKDQDVIAKKLADFQNADLELKVYQALQKVGSDSLSLAVAPVAPSYPQFIAKNRQFASAAAFTASPAHPEPPVHTTHQPLIQVKMRVVEVNRSNALQASSVLDFISSPGNPKTLIPSGVGINGAFRNVSGATRFPIPDALINGANLATLTGAGALVNLTTGNMNYIARLLQDEFHADTITAPQVVTINEQTVEFVAGERVPFALGQNVIQGNNNNIQQFFYKHVGTFISVTPRIINWGSQYGSGRGKAPLMDSDIKWKELVEFLHGKDNPGKIFYKFSKDADKDIFEFLETKMPYPPVSIKEKILARLHLQHSREEARCPDHPLNPYLDNWAVENACDPGCNWRPEDCTIDLDVIMRLSGTSTQTGTTPIGDLNFESNVRAIADIVQVKSGHGVIMGGLISEHDVKNISKVPVLGDIPAVGALFRSKTTTRQKTEIILFIEAQVLDSCPSAARAQSAHDFRFGQPYVAGEFLDNPLEFGMYRAGFGTYLPPHSHQEKVFWERLGRKVRTICTTVDDIFE